LRNGKVLMLTHVGQPVAPYDGTEATYLYDAVAKLLPLMVKVYWRNENAKDGQLSLSR
jgi:hypothetical protein